MTALDRPATDRIPNDSKGEPDRFVADLPGCCHPQPWQAPRPSTATLGFRGSFGSGDVWELGLDEWSADVEVSWYDDDSDNLWVSLLEHVGGSHRDADDHDLNNLMAAHGLAVGSDMEAVTVTAGRQSVFRAELLSETAEAAGRQTIRHGMDLWNAADAAAGDLEHLVGSIAELTNDELMNPNVISLLGDDVMCAAGILLLRDVHIAPALRGYRLGAWAAAATVATFSGANTLVATMAAPLSRRDAFPEWTSDDGHELSTAESARWAGEQQRLAAHWAETLGLRPLPDIPNVLVAYTGLINRALEATLRVWAP